MLDLLSLLDRRVLGVLLVVVSLGVAAYGWTDDSTGSAAAATALLVPAAALGGAAVVVRRVPHIVGTLALGAALMVGGIVVLGLPA